MLANDLQTIVKLKCLIDKPPLLVNLLTVTANYIVYSLPGQSTEEKTERVFFFVD